MMDVASWFRKWLARHPLKTPGGIDRSQYTEEVMAKVRALETPDAASALRWQGAWPQWAFAATAVAAMLLLVVGVPGQAPLRLADRVDVEQDIQWLAAVEPSGADALIENEPEVIADDLAVIDAMILADASAAATSSDEQWVDQTLQLLQELDEGNIEDVSGTVEEEELLEELELLDDAAMTASS